MLQVKLWKVPVGRKEKSRHSAGNLGFHGILTAYGLVIALGAAVY